MKKILIDVTPDVQLGGIEAEPRRADLRQRYRDHMRDVGAGPGEARYYNQYDWDWPSWITENARAMRDLRAGWSVSILVDPYEFGMSLGWDAYNVEVC